MALKHIDQDGIYPGGKRGLPGRAAMAIVNENSAETEERLSTLESGTGGVVGAIETLQSGLATEAQNRSQMDAVLGARIDSERESLVALGARILGKNRLINGNFDFTRRGVAGSRTSAEYVEFYTVDRWVCGFVGINGNWGVGGTPLGAIACSRRFLGYNIVSVANNNSAAYVGQKIENCDTFAGKTVTLSIWARSNVAGKKIGVRILQLMGTGGSPSANTSTECPAVAILTTSFKRHSFTVTLPSMAGKARGNNGNDSLFVVLDYCADSTFYAGQIVAQTGLFEIAQAQLEEGGVATDFDFRPLALELTLCQRYYENSYSEDIYPGSAAAVGYASALVATSGYFLSASPVFKVPKRSVPAVTTYRYDNGATGQMSEYGTTGSLQAGRPTSITNISTNGFEIRSDSSPGAGNAVRYHWAADSEL
jgi:hypothetical protein